MSTERITFEGATGHLLAAQLELPADARPRAYALFAHCFTCSKNLKAAVNITRALSGMGIGVLRFDFTGLGESEGDFADTNFTSNVDDLVAAARYIESELGAPQLLVGHSLGGAAVLHAATRLDSVRAVATIGAPAEPSHVLKHIGESREEIERLGEATVLFGGRPFRVKRQFLDDLEQQRMSEVVQNLGRALLLLHSPIDQIVGIENAETLYSLARHSKSFVSLDDADHLLMDVADSTYAGRVLSTWADRYLDPVPLIEHESELRDAERVVTRSRLGTFRTDIRVRQHALVADEPVSVGGEDTGPTPYDLLLAGLGACTSITLEMYAGRKGWPLEQARVRLKHSKIHKMDREASGDADEQLDVVDREVELIGPLDEAQRARLMEIADRCPVHRTLEAGVRVRTVEG